MRINRAKNKLRQGKMVFASWMAFPAPAIVEILAVGGVDCVLLDGEHGGLTPTEVESMVRAAEVFDITPIVRVPNSLPATIYGYLDRGAQGIAVPHVKTRGEAEAIVDAARYYPAGHRGYMLSGRQARWGTMPRDEYISQSNSEVLVVALVEDMEAIRNLDEILAVDGIDVIMLGPGDLAQSMNWPAPDELRATMSDVIRRSITAGKVASQGNVSFEQDAEARYYIELGCRFWDVTTQSLLIFGARKYSEWLRKVGAPT